MRQVLFLAVLTFFLGSTAWAESGGGASLYQVADVDVDISTDQAAHGRDMAVLQAQHTAFVTLMGRLSVSAPPEAKDDVLATLVQAFEVQKERASAVRYIGTFTVQFKPQAVRSFLEQKGSTFHEVQGQPMLILPLVQAEGGSLTFDPATAWAKAWDQTVRKSSTVPLLIPSLAADPGLVSSLEGAAEAPEGLKALMHQQGAVGVLVAVLMPKKADGTTGSQVRVTRYDNLGRASAPVAFGVETTAEALGAAARQMRMAVEKEWDPKNPAVAMAASQANGAEQKMQIMVPVNNLADWTQIKRQIETAPFVTHMTLLSLSRREARIEIGYRGSDGDVQANAAQHGLALEKRGLLWVMTPANSNEGGRL